MIMIIENQGDRACRLYRDRGATLRLGDIISYSIGQLGGGGGAQDTFFN